MELEPDNRDLLSFYAAACVGLGRHQCAIDVYRRLVADPSFSAELHVALGHSLKSVGQQKEAISSYQAAANAKPSFGDAYWSLANLKTYRFSDEEIACMRAQEASPAVREVDRCHFCFALGRAYETESNTQSRGNSMSAVMHSNVAQHAAIRTATKSIRENKSKYAQQSFLRHAASAVQRIQMRFSLSDCHALGRL